MTNFKVRAYGKSELAWLYFPTANSAHTAVNHLMAWVYRIPQLVDGLQKLGYRKTAKFFTPREVALIIDYLGEPYENPDKVCYLTQRMVSYE